MKKNAAVVARIVWMTAVTTGGMIGGTTGGTTAVTMGGTTAVMIGGTTAVMIGGTTAVMTGGTTVAMGGCMHEVQQMMATEQGTSTHAEDSRAFQNFGV